MQAIQDTNADITLWPGIIIVSPARVPSNLRPSHSRRRPQPAGETQNETDVVWQRQLTAVINAFKTYGTAKSQCIPLPALLPSSPDG